MLSSLNAALRRLRAATEVFHDAALKERLQDVMRRLLLAEVMGSHWITAVGGSQGAGKTTFLAALYDLHGDGPQWLKGNEGRGEKLPVLVCEVEGLTAPQGFVRRLVANPAVQEWEVRQVQVDMAGFQEAITDPSDGDLLPVLQVPKRYFDLPDQAWLLLPGYEEQDRDNATWQSLMRQAMVAAGGCVVVTDQTRIADKLQQDIINDMLSKELQHTQPYIVISKTEGLRHDEAAMQELRHTAQQVFKVPQELAASHIVCTGVTDPVYLKAWQDAMEPVMQSLNRDGSAKRSQQLGQLAQLVSTELGEVLMQVRTQALLYFRGGQAGASEDWVQEVLQRFHDAKAALLAEHLAVVQQVAGAKLAAAKQLLDKDLDENHEGFKQAFKRYVKGTTARKLALRKAAHDAWFKSRKDIYSDYAQGLAALTSRALGRSDIAVLPAPQAQQFLATPKGQQWLQLGYASVSGQPTVYSKLTPNAQSDLQILLNPQAQLAVVDDNAPNAQRRASKSLRKSVELIPATALEYLRLMYAAPALLALPTDSLQPQAATEQVLTGQGGAGRNEVEGTVDHATKAIELGKTAIKSLATLLAVDVATDGDSDILATIFGPSSDDASGGAGGDALAQGDDEGGHPPLAGAGVAGAAPLMLNALAIGVASVVAAGYVASRAFERLRDSESSNSIQAHRALGQIHDQYVQHFTDEATKLLNAAGKQLEESLRARYRLDEAWASKERLAVAQADVESLVHRLQDRLALSPANLQLLNAQHAR